MLSTTMWMWCDKDLYLNLRMCIAFISGCDRMPLKIWHGVHSRTNRWANISLVLKWKLLTRGKTLIPNLYDWKKKDEEVNWKNIDVGNFIFGWAWFSLSKLFVGRNHINLTSKQSRDGMNWGKLWEKKRDKGRLSHS